jgi:hypothetical protein
MLRRRSLDRRHVSHPKRGPVEKIRPSRQQYTPLGTELRTVVGRADQVRFAVSQACLDHVGARSTRFVRPSREGGTTKPMYRGRLIDPKTAQQHQHRHV